MSVGAERRSDRSQPGGVFYKASSCELERHLTHVEYLALRGVVRDDSKGISEIGRVDFVCFCSTVALQIFDYSPETF